MSKYTTEVRYICENKSGLQKSANANEVDAILEQSWNKIFTTNVDFFDEAYRKILCKKILKHYYLREIGCETVGIWILWMNTKLEEIMPYYNQLYKSELLQFNPLYDTDVTRTHNRTTDSTNNENKNRTVNGSGITKNNGSVASKSDGSSNNNSLDLYADTPQGAISTLENETYLTNARKISDNSTVTNNENITNTKNGENEYIENEENKNIETNNSTEDYLESVKGKQGGESYSSMLIKYRDTFLNIDMQVIEEFSDLFMLLW